MRRPPPVKYEIRCSCFFFAVFPSYCQVVKPATTKPAIPSSQDRVAIGAGSRQGRAQRPKGASEPQGSLDGWLRWGTIGDEGMAGGSAAVYAFIAPLTPSMRRPPPVKYEIRCSCFFFAVVPSYCQVVKPATTKPAIPSSQDRVAIGAGSRQGRAQRPKGASEPSGSLDGWLRWGTIGDEGMAGGSA